MPVGREARSCHRASLAVDAALYEGLIRCTLSQGVDVLVSLMD